MAQGQLALLFDSSRHRLVRRLGRSVPSMIGIVLAAMGIMVALGLAIVPLEVVRGDAQDPGGTVLEMAFWLTCLAAAVESFRAMEALYRTGDARKLAALPIRTTPLFVYRLAGRVGEALLVAALGTALFVPVIWRGDAALFGACAWVWTSGMLLTATVGMAVQLYAGVSNARGTGELGRGPAAFTLAPGLALAVAVIFVLLQKLVAEEFLRGGLNQGARFGLSVAAGAAVVSIGLAWRWFSSAYYAALAAFLQADLYVLDVGYEYFKEGPREVRGWERFMAPALIPMVRRDRLQYRRRHTLGRLLVWLVAVGMLTLLLARGSDALPAGLLLGSPLLVLAVFADPWGRLYAADLEPGMAEALPIDRRLHHRAKLLVALRETLELSLPLLIAIGLGVGLGHRGWLIGAVATALAAAYTWSASPLFLLAARRSSPLARILAGALGVTGMAVASIAPLALIALSLVFVGASLVASGRAAARVGPARTDRPDRTEARSGA